MTIVNRLSRLLSADVHAVLDRLEEPQALLNAAVRDMEDETTRLGQQLQRRQTELASLDRREIELSQAIAEIDEQLDLCFESGEDGLARSLIKRKLGHETLARSVATRRQNLNSELEAARKRYSEQQQRLESIRQKAELTTDDAEPTIDPLGTHLGASISEDDVEVAFLKEQARRRLS